MHKGPLADIAVIISTHDSATRRNNALRGFWQLHIFTKRGAVQRDIGTTIRCNVRDDSVTAIVGGDGVIVGQLDVIQARRFNQHGGVSDVLAKCNAIGMSDDAAVGAVVNTLAVIVIAIAGIKAAAGTVIGPTHIAAVIFPVAVPLLQAPFQAVVI